MTYISRNQRFRTLALSLGPLPANPLLPWYSGQTGGSESYGWRHDHLLDGAWTVRVLQTYAARPCYYDNAPARESGYLKGGRPIGWAAEPGSPDGLDLADGSFLFFGHDGPTVSGLDAEHFPLSPLLAVYDGGDARAGHMLRYLSAAHAGMLRKADGKLIDYIFTDRPASYILRTLVQCGKRGLLAPLDAECMTDYIVMRLLPRWEASPDTSPTGNGNDLQIYNQLFWAVPVLYDYCLALPASAYRRRLWKALDRLCERVAELQAIAPGEACGAIMVSDWTPELTVTCVSFFEPWGVRAMDVAGAVLGVPACRAEAKLTAVRWLDDPDAKRWLVDANGNWIL